MPTNPIIPTPNMNLPNPVPGIQLGPFWADNLEQSLNIIDTHNHTPGNGVAIPSAGIGINANLPLNNYSLTSVQAITFAAQSSLATLLSLYTIGNDLYFNDGASNVIQITSGGAVNATSSGISSGSATASFVSSVLVVNAAANTPANIQGASILIGNNTSGSDFITLSAPSLASNYTLTLPALPASTLFLTLTSSGTISTASSVSGSQIAAGSLTGSQLASGTVTGSQIASATVAVTNLANATTVSNTNGSSYSNNTTSFTNVVQAGSTAFAQAAARLMAISFNGPNLLMVNAVGSPEVVEVAITESINSAIMISTLITVPASSTHIVPLSAFNWTGVVNTSGATNYNFAMVAKSFSSGLTVSATGGSTITVTQV